MIFNPGPRSDTPQELRAYSVDDKRRVCKKLLELWCDLPRLRLGQLLDNAAKVELGRELFYVEDGPLIESVETLVKKFGGSSG